MPSPLPLFQITDHQIDRVVRVFYARIRAHGELGPVFAAHVRDWPAHETRIAAFWRNAILKERCYDGNPMRVHVARPEIRPDHFPLWLSLFHEVLTQELAADTAARWGALADRIGHGLKMGLTSMRQKPDDVPSLL